MPRWGAENPGVALGWFAVPYWGGENQGVALCGSDGEPQRGLVLPRALPCLSWGAPLGLLLRAPTGLGIPAQGNALGRIRRIPMRSEGAPQAVDERPAPAARRHAAFLQNAGIRGLDQTQGVALGWYAKPRWGSENQGDALGYFGVPRWAANQCALKERRRRWMRGLRPPRVAMRRSFRTRGFGALVTPGRCPGLGCATLTGQRRRHSRKNWRWAELKPSGCHAFLLNHLHKGYSGAG